ncbi:SDR family oxidoreductase [Nocardia sp. NPDC019395]|uniref:SDR family NAD(P)-dependent oxidoreductase n=1 Tax=Nocardia sp. NPDC019395 TaxID=3154686 RepID=UPI0033CF0FBD
MSTPDRNDSQRLRDRRILITGAASGIGRATAEIFHREGARLALIDRQEDALQEVSGELGALAYPLDLTDLDSVEPGIADIEKALGGLDGIVNCAGIGKAAPIGDTDLGLLMQFASVNLLAPYLICRAALPALRRAGRGATIVNVSSGMGVLPNIPNNTAYAATKGGLIAFTKGLAAEVGPQVRVNVVCPGATLTPMSAPFLADAGSAATDHLGLKRVADPSEIANGILFLTSDESSYVTGSTLAVDGGRTYH